ncbi:signal transduction histidine kinase [Frankia sp. Allo2]|nr:signal transduction histidine kinase [Frankia sp. Allo2]
MAPGSPVDAEDGGQRDGRSAAPPNPAGSGLARLRRAAANPTNWRVRTKLIAILAVPVIAILAYSSIEAGTVLTSTRDVNRVSDLTEISRSAAGLVHALQAERTYSTGFVASGPVGARDGSTIPTRRAAVDEAYRAYKSAANERRGSFGSEVRRALDDVSSRMDTLPAKRQTIERLIDRKAVETAFQPIIDSLVNLIRLIPQGNDDQELNAGVNTAYFLMSGTELLAEEQTLIHGLFTRNGNQVFTADDYREFLSAETQRGRQRNDLENAALPNQLAVYEPTIDTETNGDIRNTQNYVEEILNAPIGQPLTALEAEKWDQATQRTIDTGTEAVDKLLGLVDARAGTLRGNIQRHALLSGLLILLILALALLAALIVARSLVRPLLALRTAALDVADHRLPEAVRRLRDSTELDIDDSIEPVGIDTDEEVGEVARAFDEVHREAIRLASEQASLRNNVNAMFVNLSRRSQGLVERQLRLIDELENREQDPDQLSNLFKLDHLATRMRRNNESLLVLAGTDTARRWTHPVPLNEVVLAAISEVEQYTRVKQTSAAAVSIAGNGVSDVVHLVAELLENATSYSPPATSVLVTSRSLGPGAGAMIEIEDQGIGMPAKELERVNDRLANPPVVDVSVSRTMGLFAVGRLASRHGIHVQLRESASGGITAVVRLPAKLVTGDGGAGTGPARPAAPALGTRVGDSPAIPGSPTGPRAPQRPERTGSGTPEPVDGRVASTNGTGANGHRTASESDGPESLFDDSSGPRRFPSTGPFPLTGPLAAAQLGSDRTGSPPTADDRDFGPDDFAPGLDGGTERDSETDGISAAPPTLPHDLLGRGGNDEDHPVPGARERPGSSGQDDPRDPRQLDDRGLDLDALRGRGRTAPGGRLEPPPDVVPDTQTIDRRGFGRRDDPVTDETRPVSFGDNRWGTKPRSGGATGPGRTGQPDTTPTPPGPTPPGPTPPGPTPPGPTPPGPTPPGPTPPGPTPPGQSRPDAGERPRSAEEPPPGAGSVFARSENRPVPQERSESTESTESTGPRDRLASALASRRLRDTGTTEAVSGEDTGEQTTADRDTDDIETSPIFDSVSAWFQRRSPSDRAPAQHSTAAAAARPTGPGAGGAAPPPRSPVRPGLGGAFGQRGPARSGVDPLTATRTPAREEPATDAPSAAPPVPAFAAQHQTAPHHQPAGQYQPAQHQATPQQPPSRENWTSPGDAGWQAAELLRQPSTGGVTRSGLPVRVPMTHLVPGSAEPAPRRRPTDTSARSPEAVGGRLASFYQGVRQGRDVGVDTARNPRRDAQEER